MKVVVVGQAHAAEDDLVHVGAQGHVGHHLVVGLVRVGEEGDLLAGNQRVVEVDAGDTGRDQLGRLAALVGVDGRAADLALFALHLRTAVDGLAVGVEETAGERVADLQGRGIAEEGDFRVGGDAFRAGEHLQRGGVALGADIDDEKLGLAKQMGASYTINTKTEDVHARLLEMTSGFGKKLQ